jgi:hypothetical protein
LVRYETYLKDLSKVVFGPYNSAFNSSGLGTERERKGDSVVGPFLRVIFKLKLNTKRPKFQYCTFNSLWLLLVGFNGQYLTFFKWKISVFFIIYKNNELKNFKLWNLTAITFLKIIVETSSLRHFFIKNLKSCIIWWEFTF